MKFAIYEIEFNSEHHFLEIGYDNAICSVNFRHNKDLISEKSPISDQGFAEISAYLAGFEQNIDVDFEMCGTEFQKLVWREIEKIPYGKTATYGEIAQAIGKPKAARAVGSACNKNPLLLVLPCHRVVGATGKLVGYAGGLGLKSALLSLEKSNITNP